MWFDPTLEAAYDNGFQVGIMDAGYDSVRVDRVEHTNRIDDEIITQIKSASFVVADFTRQLHNLPVRTSVRPAEHEVLEP